MLFGSHVSIAGGIENAPKNAADLGCEVLQMFSRSPRGGKPSYTENTFEQFKTNMKEYNIKEAYIHAPYYINFASSNNRIRFGSITAIREELEVGAKIGARYVMFHTGSSTDYTEEEAFDLVVKKRDIIIEDFFW